MRVDVDVLRLAIGLAVAAVALAVAVALVVFVDWTPPSEALRPADGESVTPSGTP